jgi:hypothetical protein
MTTIKHEEKQASKSAALGPLELDRLRSQFRILVQLRPSIIKNIDNMESISSFFKVENDIFYRLGIKKGRKEGVETVVKNLLLANQFTIAQIAAYAGVPQTFIRKVKKSLSSN